MKIQDSNQRIQLEAYVTNAQATQNQHRQQQSQQVSETDRVDLSTGSRLLHRVNEALRAEDPARAAEVQALKAKILAGTYEVDPEKIAKSMIVDLVKDLG